MGKGETIATYVIIGLIILAVLNRPASSIGLAAIGSNFATTESNILSGSNSTQTLTGFSFQPTTGQLTMSAA